MKRITLIAVLLTAAASLAAQPFHSNKWYDNTFVEAGAGLNTILDNGYLGLTGAAVEVSAGKWLTPYTGIRFGYHGITDKAYDTSAGWFAGEESFGFHYLHADWMLDATSVILGYKANRMVTAVPYITAGGILATYKEKTIQEFAGGAGITVSCKVAPRVSVQADAKAVLAREEAFRDAGKIVCFPSLTVGASYNIGRTDFERHINKVDVRYIEVPAECNHRATLDSLMAALDEARKTAANVDTVLVKEILSSPEIIFFDLDKDKVSGREKAHAEYYLSHLPEDTVLHIVGHADKETGNPRHNLDLSRRRSENVRKVLLDLGWPESQITTDYKGDTANFLDTPVKNRCVTITPIVK